MCVVSMVGDYGRQAIPQQYPWVPPYIEGTGRPAVSREEFDALRRDVEELKELLKAAKRIDEATGQPDCESDAKLEVLRRVAELVGVDLDE